MTFKLLPLAQRGTVCTNVEVPLKPPGYPNPRNYLITLVAGR